MAYNIDWDKLPDYTEAKIGEFCKTGHPVELTRTGSFRHTHINRQPITEYLLPASQVFEQRLFQVVGRASFNRLVFKRVS